MRSSGGPSRSGAKENKQEGSAALNFSETDLQNEKLPGLFSAKLGRFYTEAKVIGSKLMASFAQFLLQVGKT